MPRKKYNPLLINGKLRDPTPLEHCVLSAFTPDARAHDGITIVGYLDRGAVVSSSPRLTRLKKIADDALSNLDAMGHLRRDAMGWYWLADTPPADANAAQDRHRQPHCQRQRARRA